MINQNPMFTKISNNIEFPSYKFNPKIYIKTPKSLFSYLKGYILNHPLFNLSNQNNLKQEILVNLKNSSNNECFEENIIQKNTTKTNSFETIKCLKNENEIRTNVQHRIVEDCGELFDFLTENYSNIFHEEVKKIIQILEEIIYSPPYSILFGRININKPKSNDNKKEKGVENNELFYEGFELSID